ncbi:MAG TPA: phosphoribosylglycinamide formyltransferase [Actinomycetota bacterium]|nr:phosphoribosylglycinamide formyltransferase [Actinomycetota bacterium]
MAGRIVVLISGSGTNMEALADACEAGDVPGKIVGVVADRDCIGLKAAEKRGLEGALVDFREFTSRDDWNTALRDRVKSYEPDLVVSAGFMRLLAPSFVDAFPGRIINVHPALLPAFPGAHAVRDALAAGAKVSGTTVHFMDHEMDHGQIILQEAVRVEPGEPEDELHDRIKAVEHRLLPQACRLVLDGKVRLEQGVAE